MRGLLGAAIAGVGLGPALAGEAAGGTVGAAGDLEVELSGFVRFLATAGQRDNARLDDRLSAGLDFFDDTEVHVLVKGEAPSKGLEYGAHVELEGDTNRLNQADETWIFLRGGWGEVRLGDEDGVADLDGLALSAASIAAGSGGLDADVVEDFGGGARTYEPLGTSDATKVVYRLRPRSGIRLGLSYTPSLAEIGDGDGNGDSVASRRVEAQDVAEAALGYEARLGGITVEGALSGLRGNLRDGSGDHYWAAQAGLVVGLGGGLKLAGSYLAEEAGEVEARAVTAGVAAEVGRFDVSLNYGRIVGGDGITGNGNRLDRPWSVILSADVGLMPGLVLAADVSWFDNDVRGRVEDADGDAGWQGVMRLGLAF